MNTRQLTVIIPTRNRVELAAIAMASVQGQLTDRIRVVVSDNSTDENARAHLEALCRRQRVEYMRPDTPCSMSDHWNWLLKQVCAGTRGSHFTFLTDRMFFRKNALSELMHKIDEYPDDVIAFPLDTVRDDEVPVRLQLHPWSGRTIRVAASTMASMLAHAEMPLSAPLLLNSVVPVSVLQHIRTFYTDFCDTIAPDYGFCMKFLDLHDGYYFFDKPLLVQHGLTRSNGRSFSTGRPTAEQQDFLRNLPKNQTFNQHAPIPEIPVAANTAIHEYAAMLHRGPHRAFPPVDLPAYYSRIKQQVMLLEDPVSRARFLDMIPHNKTTADTERMSHTARARKFLRLILWPVLGGLFTTIWKYGASMGIQLPGIQWLGFSTPESARTVAEQFSKKREARSFFLEQIASYEHDDGGTRPARETTP